MALFNSITGQPKEKLFEMPQLIQQISLEVDPKKIEQNLSPDKNPGKLKKIQSFSRNIVSKKKNSEDEIPTKIDFHFKHEDLQSLNDWDFFVPEVSSNMMKYNLIWMMFHSLGYLEKYEINSDVFGRFLYILHEKYNYRKNPFHNFDHGFTGIN